MHAVFMYPICVSAAIRAKPMLLEEPLGRGSVPHPALPTLVTLGREPYSEVEGHRNHERNRTWVCRGGVTWQASVSVRVRVTVSLVFRSRLGVVQNHVWVCRLVWVRVRVRVRVIVGLQAYRDHAAHITLKRTPDGIVHTLP